MKCRQASEVFDAASFCTLRRRKNAADGQQACGVGKVKRAANPSIHHLSRQPNVREGRALKGARVGDESKAVGMTQADGFAV